MTRFSHIYILHKYANDENFKEETYATEHESWIVYTQGSLQIRISETNSLVEDKYSMNLHSAEYLVEGRTDVKKAMIHHHPQGHQDRHLQFKLKTENKVIRISLEPMDIEDYKRCIKGFIATTKEIIEFEKKEYGIKDDLVSFFFNKNINELEGDRRYLLGRIKMAYNQGRFLDENEKSVSQSDLIALKKEPHLLPFLEWK